jgi:hypothetical protein
MLADAESQERILNFQGMTFASLQQVRPLQEHGATPHSRRPKAFRYRFNCPNPWEGPWKGYATHILDIIFALLNYTEHLDNRQRNGVERLAKDMITFVHGDQPWGEYRTDARGSMVYHAAMEGDSNMSQFYKDYSAANTGRRDHLQEIVQPEHFVRLMHVADVHGRSLIKVRSNPASDG